MILTSLSSTTLVWEMDNIVVVCRLAIPVLWVEEGAAVWPITFFAKLVVPRRWAESADS